MQIFLYRIWNIGRDFIFQKTKVNENTIYLYIVSTYIETCPVKKAPWIAHLSAFQFYSGRKPLQDAHICTLKGKCTIIMI